MIVIGRQVIPRFLYWIAMGYSFLYSFFLFIQCELSWRTFSLSETIDQSAAKPLSLSLFSDSNWRNKEINNRTWTYSKCYKTYPDVFLTLGTDLFVLLPVRRPRKLNTSEKSDEIGLFRNGNSIPVDQLDEERNSDFGPRRTP
jgi:hypothetical protein